MLKYFSAQYLSLLNGNAVPTGLGETVTTNEDTEFAFAASNFNFADVDSDSLDHVNISSLPVLGTLQLDGNDIQVVDSEVSASDIQNLKYVPLADANGTSYASFYFRVNDGADDSKAAYEMIINVAAVNDAPVANDDSAATDEDTAVTIPVIVGDANNSNAGADTDVDNDTLSVTAIGTGNDAPSDGTATIDSGSRTITYSPADNFNGTDSFKYTVSDGNGGTDIATVTVTVNSVNDAPVANDDSAETFEDIDVTIPVIDGDANNSNAGADTDVDNDPLSVTAIGTGNDAPSDGTATIDSGSRTITYSPADNFNGTDSFKYTVSDGKGGTNTATVTVTVNSVNDPPVANDDSAATDEDTAVTIPVIVGDANNSNAGADTDVENDTLSVTAIGTGNDAPSNGTATIDSGSRTITYSPADNFNGTDSFKYTVSDGNGGTDTATVTVTVNSVNDPPTANLVAVALFDDERYTFEAADFGFSDIDSDTALNQDPMLGADTPRFDMLAHVKITSLPAMGTLLLNDTAIAAASSENPVEVTKAQLDAGALVYTPPDIEGGGAVRAMFDFKVNDGELDSVAAYTSSFGVTPVLSVRFGAASYVAEEDGDAVTIEVKLSYPAVRSLEIPVTVKADTAEPTDYTVAVKDPDVWDAGTGTVMLTFMTDVDTRIITVEPEQDDGHSDEMVMLGFGTMPPGAVASTEEGTAVTATLVIADDEGARIRARFRRLNAEILSKHALTLADVTSRAIGARMDEACGEKAAAYTLAGGSTLYHTLRSNAQAIEDGTLTLDDVLAGSSFRLPLAAANDDLAGGVGGPVLWGRGERQALESRESAFAWDGTVLTGQIGIDGCLRDDFLAGLALSRSLGEFDYTDGTGPAPVSGGYESRMTSVHPYLGWTSPQGLDLWATLGYGRGEIEIDDEQVRRIDPGNPVRRSDTTLKTAALGASGPLMTDGSLGEGGRTTLMLKGEASVARVEVAGNDELIETQAVHANRLRLALEGSHEQALASGGSLTPSLELGLRHDGGDGETGGGVEIAGGLRYRDPATGLTVEGNGRVLTGQGDYREWGLGGSLRVDSDAEGRGLSFSLTPAWGDTASGVARLWDQDVAELASDDTAANDNVPQMRLDSELGYGLGTLGGHGLLTPYGGFSLAGEGSQRYRIGGRFEIGSSLNLSLEGERREPANAAAAEHGVMLRLQTSW